MKTYLSQAVGTTEIEEVSFDELKEKIEGKGLIDRIKYRKNLV